MIVASVLLADLKRQVAALETDLRARSDAVDDPWGQALRAEHAAASSRGRTALSWVEWRDGEVANAAVGWVLATVFVRFCEDNALIDGVWLAGPEARLQQAVDSETAFYQAEPSRNSRDWLHDAFTALAALPAGRDLVDPAHHPAWRATISADSAAGLLAFWRRQDAAGGLVHDFTVPSLSTRFLGDLYQDLSESAKKRYALLQTPEFVEEFILDQTLTPALAEFGLEGLRLIDPTCGSGHFLLGAFDRLLDRWEVHAPGLDRRERVQRALDSVHGVDLNPFAVAIARFRLTVAALQASGLTRLADTPAFRFHLAIGDSLLGGVAQGELFDDSGVAGFHYRDEDIHEHPGILTAGRYHVVVGNPPYITVKDKALNEAYRVVYSTCKGKYALSVPFMELFFQLAIRGTADIAAGFVGQITSNSFMKREFGSKLIESLLSGADPLNPVDLLDVIDTSGAYIPGHGTPTVILVGRRRRPVATSVRAVLGVRGEPGQPDNPAKGLVWAQIVDHIDEPGFDGDYVTITDLERNVLMAHPWSLSGGGAGDVKEQMETRADRRFGEDVFRIGFFGIQANDEAYLFDEATVRRRRLEGMRAEAVGESVRDYEGAVFTFTFFPYDAHHDLLPLEAFPNIGRSMWTLRTDLGNRATFSRGTYFSDGRPWYEWHQLPKDEGAHPWVIAFAFVATHNHFVLDRGARIFHRSAPVIKLPAGASEDDHLGLLAVLNSSSACFWLKQVSHNKGSTVDTKGARQTTVEWENFYEFTGTKLQEFPLPDSLPLRWGKRLDALSQELAVASPAAVCSAGTPTRMALDAARSAYLRVRSEMIAAQEELDWHVYGLYGLVDGDLTFAGAPGGLSLGERAFEIVLARRVAAGEESTVWFSRHGSVPITEIPASWPENYRATVQRRLDVIASNPAVRLLERPEFKRRWASESWEVMEFRAVSEWVLGRLEESELWQVESGPRVLSVAQLADRVRADEQLLEALRLLTRAVDIDVTAELGKLLADQAVPFLAAYRYSESGLRKRAEWEQVWALQRREDAGEKVDIPVPPKYKNTDFCKASFWSARGKLDVPKERFVLYPDAGREGDPTAVLGWAGWDRLEQARTLASLIVARGQDEQWSAERLVPLLAGLAELEPWLHQWHDDPDPTFGGSPAVFFTRFVDGELGRIGRTRDDLATWRPEAPTRGRRRAAAGSSPDPASDEEPSA